MREFYGARLTLARQLRGYSKTELARAIDATESSLTHWESDRNRPQPEMLQRLARVLDFPLSFFAHASRVAVSHENVSFRSLRTLTRRDRDRACASTELVAEIGAWIDRKYQLPSVSVPDLSDAPASLAAQEMRRILLVGTDPLPSTLGLLEHLGVRCFSLGVDITKADALSTWIDGVPYVLFNVNKSAARARNDASHELGHLALHRHRVPTGERAELEAVEFAAEFLCPRERILLEAPTVLSLSSLITLKQRWGVSAAFMLKRLADLERVSEWTARSLWRQLNMLGYLKGEPGDGARERSQVLTQVVEHQRSLGRRPFATIAAELDLSASEVRARFDGLLPIGLHVNESVSTIDNAASTSRPALKLLS